MTTHLKPGVWATILLALLPMTVQAQGVKPELQLQLGHAAFVSSVAVSPDAKSVLTGSTDNTARLWDVATGRTTQTFIGHTESVNSVAFSPDGKSVLTGSWDKTAKLWDVGTGKAAQTFTGHKEGVNSVAFSPDGKSVLTGSADNTARLWDIATGTPIQTFTGHTDSVDSVAFSPDGKSLLTGSANKDKSAKLWDVGTGKTTRIFAGHSGGVSSVAFSPDGKSVLTGSSDDPARLWNVATGKTTLTFMGHTSPVQSVALSPDGMRALTGSSDKTAKLWDVTTGKATHTFAGDAGWVTSVAFSPDGKSVLTGSADNTARLWDIATGRTTQNFTGHTSMVLSVAFGADGNRVLTGSIRDTARVWDLAAGKITPTFTGHSDLILAAAFSPDGNSVLTSSLLLDEDANRLWDGLRLRDLATGKTLHTFSGHINVVSSVAFSSDGKSVLTGSQDNTARLWDVVTGKTAQTFAGHTSAVNSARFSPDGKSILTGSIDQTARLWDIPTGKVIQTFAGHKGGIDVVAFGVDGKTVLTGSRDHTARQWDIATGKTTQTFAEHTEVVTSVAFSPDGMRALTGSWDKTAKLWDVGTGKAAQTFTGHKEGVNSVAFSPDGKSVLTGSADGTTRLWEAKTGRELCVLMSFKDSNDWLVTTPEGLFDGSLRARELVEFKVGTGTIAPVDRFFQDFYHPGLLAALWKGERPRPTADFAAQAPPTVRFAAPAANAAVEADAADVVVEATDQGGGVSGPTLYQNGTRILAGVETTKDGKVTRRAFRVKLVEGENRLEAKAASGDGGWESEPARVTVTSARPPVRPDLYVLAVGINDYADERIRLSFAGADAKAFGDVFGRRGKSIYAAVHVTYLLDGKATRAGLRDALGAVAAKAQPRDTFILTVSGHGTTLGQRYYLLPHEFDGKRFPTTEENVRRQGIPIDELGDLLDRVPALRRVLILDTCGSGGATGLLQKGRNPFAFRGEIERLNRSRGVFTIAACAAGEEAQEAKELGHGLLSYSLLAGLRAVDRGPLESRGVSPSNPQQVVDVLEWFAYASGQAPGLMRRYFGREQDVHTSGSGNSFPLLPLYDR